MDPKSFSKWRTFNQTKRLKGFVYKYQDKQRCQTSYIKRRGLVINKPSDTLNTALRELAGHGALGRVRALLQDNQNIDPDASDERGRTALHYACRRGYDLVVEILLKNKSDANKSDADGVTPLHIACRIGSMGCATILIKAKADLESRAGKVGNDTPLHFASANGKLDVVELLLRSKANAFAQNNKQNTALHLAAIKGHTEIVHVLGEDTTALAMVNIAGMDPLSVAAANGRLEVVKSLLTLKASVTNLEADGHPGVSLMAAAIEGDSADVVQTLLEAKATVEDSRLDSVARGHAVLALAHSNPEIQRLLRSAGAVGPTKKVKSASPILKPPTLYTGLALTTFNKSYDVAVEEAADSVAEAKHSRAMKMLRHAQRHAYCAEYPESGRTPPMDTVKSFKFKSLPMPNYSKEHRRLKRYTAKLSRKHKPKKMKIPKMLNPKSKHGRKVRRIAEAYDTRLSESMGPEPTFQPKRSPPPKDYAKEQAKFVAFMDARTPKRPTTCAPFQFDVEGSERQLRIQSIQERVDMRHTALMEMERQMGSELSPPLPTAPDFRRSPTLLPRMNHTYIARRNFIMGIRPGVDGDDDTPGVDA